MDRWARKEATAVVSVVCPTCRTRRALTSEEAHALRERVMLRALCCSLPCKHAYLAVCFTRLRELQQRFQHTPTQRLAAEMSVLDTGTYPDAFSLEP